MAAPPYDQAAERALVGAMVQWPSTIGDITEVLVADDLYLPKHRAIFLAASKLHYSGEAVTTTTVADECKRQGLSDVTTPDLIEIGHEEGGLSWRRFADIVTSSSMRRRLLSAASELSAAAVDATLAPADVLESHMSMVTGISSPLIHREPDDIAVEDFVNRPREQIAPWVVHGLIRRRHRVMIVAAEGSGKSWLLRFIAICAAYGIQPFRHQEIPQVRTLIVDLENPEDALYDSFEPMLRQAQRSSSVTTTTNRLWWRPTGINLRSRADLAEFENVIAIRRPDLICLGPLYNAFEISSKDFGWETAAREVQQSINKLRRKYDFALLIEDHAPQEPMAGKRKMRPYGSSLWLRWPEMGIALEKVEGVEDEYALERWRGDRVPGDWPSTIRRSKPWPFEATWMPKDRI